MESFGQPKEDRQVITRGKSIGQLAGTSSVPKR